ncbi:MAG: hypothetical protein H6610_04355 [Ignavibacteriales bacterium]|nr:hypothetical protein [Ignavibacteriales bacterium]MCB9218678.1 hypothetical protein [Ignavibacteriales bacterium]
MSKNYNSLKIDKLLKYSLNIVIIVCLISLTNCSDETTMPDTNPPNTPQNFTLLGGGDGQARFRWTKSNEPDLQFYRLYRAVNNPNLLDTLVETTQTEYLDQFLSYDSTYYYGLAAVDFNDNESELSHIIDVQPLNISAPLPPTFLIVNAFNNTIENRKYINLSWLPPAAGDLSYFKIYRGITKDFIINSNSLIDSTLLGTYYDNLVETNKRFYYKVKAVDIGGKESAVSIGNSDLILDNPELTSPSNFSKFTSPFTFKWNSVDSAKAYKVFVGNSPFADIIWESNKIKSTETNYQGPKFVTSKLYYWWVGTYSRDKILVDNVTELEAQINSLSTVRSFIGE